MTILSDQWIRKCGLFVFSENEILDLSEFRIQFDVQNADVESPNNASIRIHNLSRETREKIINGGEFNGVVLNAGYQSGNYGVIFQGEIMQFGTGKSSNISTYLDIFAADGDIAYNQGFINKTLSAGYKQTDVIKEAASAMGLAADLGSLKTDAQHFPNIRGKVLFGMARTHLRNSSKTLDSGWNIQSGQIVVTDNSGYREGDAVVLNSATGLIGMPEQTDQGIRIKCLLNSRIRIGSLVQLNNSSINETIFNKSAPTQYNSYKQIQPLAPLSEDGTYRILVCEHEGDTRGSNWYSNLVGLAFDPVKKITLAQ